MDIDIFQRIHVADQQADGKMLIFLKSESESESCSVVSDSLRAHGLCSQWNPLSQNTGLGSLSVLQGIFPTQELNLGLLHCGWNLYHLSYQGSPVMSSRII